MLLLPLLLCNLSYRQTVIVGIKWVFFPVRYTNFVLFTIGIICLQRHDCASWG